LAYAVSGKARPLTEPDRRPPAQVGQLEIGFTVAAEIDAEQRNSAVGLHLGLRQLVISFHHN
jgi:hypothetical protein